MKTLRRALAAAGALIIAVAVAVFEARQASRLRRDLAMAEEKRSQLAVELEGNTRQLDEATQRLAAVRARNDLLQQQSSSDPIVCLPRK